MLYHVISLYVLCFIFVYYIHYSLSSIIFFALYHFIIFYICIISYHIISLYVCAVNIYIYIYICFIRTISIHIHIHIHMPWMNDLRCFVNCCTDTNSNRFSLTAAWCNSMRERLATRHTSWSSRGVSAATLLPVWLLIFVRLASCTPSRVYESQGEVACLLCLVSMVHRVDREKCSYAMISHSISGAKEKKWIT